MTEEQSIRRARLCAAVSCILFAAVLIAGGTRSAREKRPEPMAAQTPEAEIAVFASDRNALREAEMERLQEIASDETAAEAIRSSAQERIMQLMDWMEKEATVEAVLNARGYLTPVVTVHSDSVNVIVQSDGLTREEAGVILELVMRETGVTGGNVKIIPIN